MATKIYQNASLNGIPLQCQSTEDGFEKAISKQEFPYVNGGNTDDLGQKIPTITLRCSFFNANYPNHLKLIELGKVFDLLELIHPIYGLKKVRIERLVARHDDEAQEAIIDISLLEDGTPQVQVKPFQDINDQVEKEYVNAVAEHKQSVLEKIAALGKKGEAYCQAELGKFGALMTDVANPANTLTSLVDYGTDLPGQFVQAASLAVERYAIAYNTLRNSPAAFMTSLSSSLGELKAQFEHFGPQVDAVSASRLSVETAGIYSADQQLRARNKTADTAGGFDVEGNRVSVSTDDSLNSAEIETVLALTDTAIQTALEGDRGNTALKRMAADLYLAAAQLKKSAENVITVRIDSPMPLHLICLRYGLPYTAAPRVLALNPQIMDPNRVSGEIFIYG